MVTANSTMMRLLECLIRDNSSDKEKRMSLRKQSSQDLRRVFTGSERLLESESCENKNISLVLSQVKAAYISNKLLIKNDPIFL